MILLKIIEKIISRRAGCTFVVKRQCMESEKVEKTSIVHIFSRLEEYGIHFYFISMERIDYVHELKRGHYIGWDKDTEEALQCWASYPNIKKGSGGWGRKRRKKKKGGSAIWRKLCVD